ncbi:hypothetical protein CY0110_23086 [Crocosphaera chwakensis CCY0110]|uniref:Uncharacterized protein n=1 Tax=Crocosphaera chwakensis CCY0110 TaxID=391612 RepID=A3IWX6_9CHRO|nr:hypothetical protein CY0110_23086 [Crocosphaera chwakensis CCY0110]
MTITKKEITQYNNEENSYILAYIVYL